MAAKTKHCGKEINPTQFHRHKLKPLVGKMILQEKKTKIATSHACLNNASKYSKNARVTTIGNNPSYYLGLSHEKEAGPFLIEDFVVSTSSIAPNLMYNRVNSI